MARSGLLMDHQKYQYQPILRINCIYSSKWFPKDGFCNFLPLSTWWTERCNSMLKCGKWNQVAVADGKWKVGRASLVEFLCHVRAVGRCFVGDSCPIFHSAWCCVELHLVWRCQLENLGDNGNLQTNLGSKFSVVFVWAWQTGKKRQYLYIEFAGPKSAADELKKKCKPWSMRWFKVFSLQYLNIGKTF